jgi:hypothetical protein
MSSLDNDANEPVKPTIQFTSAEEPNQETSNFAPRMESSSTDSVPQSSRWLKWWPIVLLITIFAECATYASCASAHFFDSFKTLRQIIRSTGHDLLFYFESNECEEVGCKLLNHSIQAILSSFWQYI